MKFFTENADYHVHTVFSDGIAEPEELVKIAISKGYRALGFSDHSYTSFDTSYCIPLDRIDEYKRTINGLKTKYRDKIDIFCGIEQDYYSDFPAEGYDYIIGSVHYIQCGKEYIPVDETPAILRQAVKDYFCGDSYEMITKYYATVSDVVNKTNADIIGHFDLITKFCETNEFNFPVQIFDEFNPRYISAWRFAIDKLLATKAVFEINFGALSRGFRTVPYPSPSITEYLSRAGCTLIKNSDNHSFLE